MAKAAQREARRHTTAESAAPTTHQSPEAGPAQSATSKSSEVTSTSTDTNAEFAAPPPPQPSPSGDTPPLTAEG
ncbi:MAG TPA: hypothetical protein VGS08_03725 [Candidatus Saccharimonadales bacterium]|nr:hypothetical protein [Candidatus Saccharimonadales bacterium]